jgi:hypothetical protein
MFACRKGANRRRVSKKTPAPVSNASVAYADPMPDVAAACAAALVSHGLLPGAASILSC